LQMGIAQNDEYFAATNNLAGVVSAVEGQLVGPADAHTALAI
jgi:hypothetical protein